MNSACFSACDSDVTDHICSVNRWSDFDYYEKTVTWQLALQHDCHIDQHINKNFKHLANALNYRNEQIFVDHHSKNSTDPVRVSYIQW